MQHLVRYSLAATILAVGMVISAALISRFFLRVHQEKEIRVKGFAEAPILSDGGKLRFSLSVRREAREEAYLTLTQQVGEILGKVRETAPTDFEIREHNPDISERYKLNDKGTKTHDVESYLASQTVTLSSSDVKWIKLTGTNLNKLIGQGFDIDVKAPSFLVSNLTDIKQKLLERATADGYRRADMMARHSGARVGALRSARQGVFQITQPKSTRTSSYGIYDTSTIEKSIKAVVTLEYSVE
ncbi:MAG: SIMPL domain-containing protein [Planctomycetota bacterium]|nr:SIMPL domain-containing protein [Planctomycetota bacterium]